MNVFSLMPSFLQSLVPYESPRDNAPVGMVWLNTNEYPQSTKYEMSFENLNRYPEVQPALLCKRYAAYAGIKQEEVLITRGGDEAIELLQEVIDQGWDTYETYNNLVILNEKQGNLTEAQNALDTMKEQFGDDYNIEKVENM